MPDEPVLLAQEDAIDGVRPTVICDRDGSGRNVKYWWWGCGSVTRAKTLG